MIHSLIQLSNSSRLMIQSQQFLSRGIFGLTCTQYYMALNIEDKLHKLILWSFLPSFPPPQ